MGNEEQKIYEDEPLSKLLGALKHVEAPNDFDFRVKARIADGKPVERSASWLPASIRYAVPLVLLLLVGGYFAFNAFYSAKKIDAPAVAETRTIDDTPLSEPASNKYVVLPSNQLVAGSGEVKSPATGTKGLIKEPVTKVPEI